MALNYVNNRKEVMNSLDLCEASDSGMIKIGERDFNCYNLYEFLEPFNFVNILTNLKYSTGVELGLKFMAL